jgi:hypothetical protein
MPPFFNVTSYPRLEGKEAGSLQGQDSKASSSIKNPFLRHEGIGGAEIQLHSLITSAVEEVSG